MNSNTKFSEFYSDLLNPSYHNIMPLYDEYNFPQATEEFRIHKIKLQITNYRRNSQICTFVFINKDKYEQQINSSCNFNSQDKMDLNMSEIYETETLNQTFTSIEDQLKNLSFLNNSISNCSKQFHQNEEQFERNWKAQKNKNPVLIYLHSHGGHLFEGSTLIQPFLKQGIDVVLFDFSGFGLSTGDRVTFGLEEQYDIEVVIQYLKKHFNYTQFGLYGRSMGALAALFYTQHSFDIKFLILDSLIQSFKINAIKFIDNHENNFFKKVVAKIGLNLIKNKIKQQYKLDLEQIDIQIPAQQISCPVLLVYGNDDQIINQQNRQDIYNYFNTEKYIIQVPTKDHFSSKLTQKVLQEILQFSQKYFQFQEENKLQKYLKIYNKRAKLHKKKLCSSLLDIDIGLLLNKDNQIKSKYKQRENILLKTFKQKNFWKIFLNQKNYNQMQSQRESQKYSVWQPEVFNNQDLSKFRVLKQNLAFISGITPLIANVSILKSKQFFGHYGTVQSIKLKREYYYGDKNKKRVSFSAYVSFKSSLSAKLAILSLKDVKMNNMIMKSCLGFTKVCKSYLNGQHCQNYKNCQYLHTLQFNEPFIKINDKESIKQLSRINIQNFIKNLTQKQFQKLLKYKNQKSVQNTFFPNRIKIVEEIIQKLSLQKQIYLNFQQPSLQATTLLSNNLWQNIKESEHKDNCKVFKRKKNDFEKQMFIILSPQDTQNLNKKILQTKFKSIPMQDLQNQFYGYNIWNCNQNFLDRQKLNQLIRTIKPFSFNYLFFIQ